MSGFEADDKILAVLTGDKVFGSLGDLDALPGGILERIEHYFLTYKSLPGSTNVCKITRTYGREEAYAVIRTAQADYRDLISTQKS